MGLAGTAEHVERIVRGWRRVDRKVEVEETARRHKHRALHVYHDDDGMVIIRARLEPQAGAVFIQAIAAGKRPASMDVAETVVYNFGTELLNTKQVSDPVFKAAVDKFGERGVVDLIGVMGYYQLVSMLLNVDRYPLSAGEKPELQALK